MSGGDEGAPPDGVLTREHVKSALSGLGATTDGSSMVYQRCDLSNLNLRDISMLGGYSQLQHVNVNGNLLKDLKALAGLKSLRFLSAKANRLRDPEDDEEAKQWLPPVFGLQEVDLSGNMLTRAPVLTGHKYLKSLRLDGNELTDLANLEGATSLIDLSANDNQLTEIKGLEGTSIRRLSLSGNNITDLSGVACLKGTLEELFLNSNELTRLGRVGELKKLRRLELSGNRLSSADEFHSLKGLEYLRSAAVDENPVFDGLGCAPDVPSDHSDADSDIVIEDTNSLACPAAASEAAAAAAAAAESDTIFRPKINPSPSLLPPETLSRYRLIYIMPQLTSLNRTDITKQEKVKAMNVFANADIESRARHEIQYLKTSVTTIGEP